MKVEQLKQNSIIKLDISTHFFQRLQNLALHLQEFYTEEELQAAFKKIEKDEPLEDREEVLETALILVGSLEEEAKKQGLTEFVEVPDQMPETEGL